MSKMFDALRRAEAERKRKARESHRVEESVTQQPKPDNDTAARQSPAQTQPSAPSPQPVQRQQPVPAQAPSRRLTPEAVSQEPPAQDPARTSHNEDTMSEEFLKELGILKNAVDAALKETPRRAIVFTSGNAREGVTTLLTGYAHLVAMSTQKRVLVLEMNARRPAMLWRMGLTHNRGAMDVMAGKCRVDEAIHTLPNAPFDVMPVGDGDAAQLQLLIENGLGRLIAGVRDAYDTVLIDCPPAADCPETPPIASVADGTVVVVHAGRTKREIVQRSVDAIEQTDGRVLGVVLNRKRYYIPNFIYRRI